MIPKPVVWILVLVVLGVFGCATAPVDVEVPTGARHFVVRR